MSTAKTLAKEIVRSRKAVNRLHTSKAQMNSVVMQMQNQLAQRKVTGHMQKSAEVRAVGGDSSTPAGQRRQQHARGPSPPVRPSHTPRRRRRPRR